jgi:hypothetical protein
VEETKRETSPQRYRQIAKSWFPEFEKASNWTVTEAKKRGRVRKNDPRETADGEFRGRVRRRAKGYDAILYRRIEEKKSEQQDQSSKG